MNVTDAVRVRHSSRAFKSDPVSREMVTELIEHASRSPSGGNLQPWIIHVLTGAPLAELKALIKSKLNAGETEAPEYDVYPPKLWEPLRTRRRVAGALRFEALNHPDKSQEQRILLERNYAFFGAPVGLFFLLDRRVGPPQWADMGMFMQTLMLLCVERGLATCPQEVWANWPITVPKFLGTQEHLMLFAGMSLGYEDPKDSINGFRTPREPVASFTVFRGFDEAVVGAPRPDLYPVT